MIDEQALSRTIATIVTEVIAPGAVTVDRGGIYPRAGMVALGRAILGLPLF